MVAGGGVLLADAAARWSGQGSRKGVEGDGGGPIKASVGGGSDQLAAAVAGDDQMVVVRE